jgi:hypothetical protein
LLGVTREAVKKHLPVRSGNGLFALCKNAQFNNFAGSKSKKPIMTMQEVKRVTEDIESRCGGPEAWDELLKLTALLTHATDEDDQPTGLEILIAANTLVQFPAESRREHLQALSKITEHFTIPTRCAFLLAAKQAASLNQWPAIIDLYQTFGGLNNGDWYRSKNALTSFESLKEEFQQNAQFISPIFERTQSKLTPLEAFKLCLKFSPQGRAYATLASTALRTVAGGLPADPATLITMSRFESQGAQWQGMIDTMRAMADAAQLRQVGAWGDSTRYTAMRPNAIAAANLFEMTNCFMFVQPEAPPAYEPPAPL